MKKYVFAFLLLSGPAAIFDSAAGAQTLPEDPALQRAQADAAINQTLQQTQQNNANLQYQLQQNEQRQQQQFNSMPPPAYEQPAYQAGPVFQPPANAPPTPLTPLTPQK